MRLHDCIAVYRDHGVTADNIASRSDVAVEERVKARRTLYHNGVSLGDIADFERHTFGGRAGKSSIGYSIGVYKK
jgi:hypothetical protein